MRSLPLPLIRRLVPLKGLREHSLQVLLEHSEWQLVGRGQRLFSLADYNRCHVYLLSGEAELQFPQGSVVHTAETLFPVGYGLSGLAATLALTDCVCLFIDKQQLDRQLCWDQVAAAIELDLSYQTEHEEEVSWRLTLLKSNLFVKVPPLNVDQIYSRLKPMQVKAGEVILRQGDTGDGCYFIRRGKAAVTRRVAADAPEQHLVEIGYGRCFGEDALVYDTVRNASVTMSTDGLLMRLDKPDFMLLLREPAIEHIKSSDLDVQIASGARVLDVRTRDEFDVARMPGALSAPLGCLRLLAETQLHRQHEYVMYCDSGLRSRAAASLLQKMGFRAKYLLNGLQGLGPDHRQRFLDVVPPLSPASAIASDAVGF
ncbi:MAG TPA: cyclic nucleotide-binding domain-containing protein [Pseudomonadales bacterium]|nr:cyclic nucleotide-binding domain-containing protein [Pseudomonadales bacterium]